VSSNDPIPDYELADELVITALPQVRALTDPLRSTILELVLERAATVTELSSAVGRPKSTVAHHVNVLLDAELLKVVRTRRVRAIDERFYGRTARLFRVGALNWPGQEPAVFWENELSVAAAEAAAAHEADVLRTVHRHARIPHERTKEFWERVLTLVHEFSQVPRAGDTVYGFIVGLYPTDHPSLPEKHDESPG
jgi:DNA-binding transcriptional ArsR family regulator